MAEKYTNEDLFQYSADQVRLTWIDLDLTPGLQNGDGVVSITLDTPQIEVLPDGLGGGIIKRNKNRTGTCTVILDGTHPINQRLIATMNSIEFNGVMINGPLRLKDDWNGQDLVMSVAIPVDYPGIYRGITAGTQQWDFRFVGFKLKPNLFRKNQIR